MEIEVKLQMDGDTFRVALPTYHVIPGSYGPITEGMIHVNGVYPNQERDVIMALEPYCRVIIPDDEGNPVTRYASPDLIRAKYHSNPKWNKSDILPDITRRINAHQTANRGAPGIAEDWPRPGY